MDTAISYRYFRPDKSPELTEQVVECYRQVFADPPWNEWKRCSVCEKSWGKKDQGVLEEMNYTHCNQLLVDYWPASEVERDVVHEITGNASCWIAESEGQVIGFCWGYPVTAEDLEAKLKIPLADVLVEKFGLVTFGYQDELGVLDAFRGRKIAKQLFLHRHSDFQVRGVEVGVVRTRELPEPSVTYQWFTEKLGYEPVYRYPEGDGRIVLAKTLTDLDGLL